MTVNLACILEKWPMELAAPRANHEEWFLDWVLRSPTQAGHHLTAGWHALNSLKEVYREADDIESCMEYFGGMGAQALMTERLFNLKDHIVGEYSQDGVEHLRRVLDRNIEVRKQDSYAPASFQPADLVMLDFGDLTVWKTRGGEKHCELLDRVFSEEPKAVVFTDIACRYLHLHRERYETLLGPGTCATYSDYLVALLRRFEELWGYTLVKGYWDRWSTVMALVPSGLSTYPAIYPTPPSPVGLEIL